MNNINIKGIKPLNNQVITTAEEYDEDVMAGTIIDAKHTKGTLKEYQKVVAVGPMVRSIEVGDLVMVNPKRFAKCKHQPGSLKDGVITDNPVIRYDFPIIEIDHTNHLFLHDQDIDFVITDFEEEQTTNNTGSLIVPDTKIIL
jgi:chaperonin 10 Kd subunit|nr:MAG TPA: mHsp60, mHsp10, Mitochondrial, Chaperonin, Complex, Symmetric [Crassvirales sp.]